MLSSLQIENVAVIQKANVHFEKGLNVLTGETGAGKSILIDSINAILGNRTSKDLVRTGAAKAVIRAAFEDVPPAVLDSLEKAGYERSEALLLSREITAEGKSTCRINGMPATAAVLRELCGGLININGQHDSVGLLNPARHEGILDAYAQNSAEYQAYYAIYRELVGVKKTLDAMITDESEKQRRIDLLSYQVQEIDDAGLTAGEEQTLESRRKVLANASTIRDRIAQCYALLSGGDEAPGAVDLLGEASNAVDAAAQLDGELSAGAGQLLDLYYTAKDVAADLIGRLDAYDTNDAELDEIEQRIDLIYKLRRKYGDTVEDILAFGERARKELEMIQSSQERVEHLQKEQRRLYTLAREKAEALTQTRLKAFDELNKRISGTLDFLNILPNYLGVSDNLDTVIEYIMARDITTLPAGRTRIDGDKAVVTVSTVTPQTSDKALFQRHDNHITLETDLDGSELFEVSLAELTPTKPTDEAADTTVGTAGTSIAGMLCEGRFALYLAGEPYKSGLKAQGCGKLKKAVFSIELDPDEEETEE